MDGQAGYVGDWLQGKRCGYGTCVYSDGDKYSGEWSDDRWHGKGIKYDDYKNEVVMGNWEFD